MIVAIFTPIFSTVAIYESLRYHKKIPSEFSDLRALEPRARDTTHGSINGLVGRLEQSLNCPIIPSVVTALEKLRRRRKPLARLLVLLVSWVWLSASASPCLGMVADTGELAHDSAHHAQEAPAPNSEHQSARGHDGHCPHCTPAATGDHDGPVSSHISCSAADDRSNDNGRSAGQNWKGKYAPLVQLIPSSGPLIRLPSAAVLPADVGSATSPLSLNLRYCVFLN